MLIRIDPTASTSLADQIAASVRHAVIRGELSPGDRLPPAREVATALGINLHTVLRGYQQLRNEGLLDMRRGRNAELTAAADAQRLGVSEQVRDLVEAARRAGIEEADLHAAIGHAFDTTQPEPPDEESTPPGAKQSMRQHRKASRARLLDASDEGGAS